MKSLLLIRKFVRKALTEPRALTVIFSCSLIHLLTLRFFARWVFCDMTILKEVVRVGIADMNVVKVPNTIRTSGLGSCVGVVLYDDKKKIAGMVHICLLYTSDAADDLLC